MIMSDGDKQQVEESEKITVDDRQKSSKNEVSTTEEKNEVELIQQDIRFVDLKKPKWVTPNSYIKSNYIIYQLLIIMGLLLFPYLYGYILKIKTDSNRILIRKFNSTIAKLELKDISLEKKCDLFNDAIIDLINYKKNQNFNYYSIKQINTIFSEHKISLKLIKEVNSIFSQIQEYNFSKEKQVAHDFLYQSEKLIKSINDEWIK